MKAGQLDQRVTVERLQGGFDELGQPLPDTWAPLFTCWAAVEPLVGREYIAAQAAVSEVTARIRMRFRPWMTAEDRVIHNHNKPSTVVVHPWQLRAVCEQFGILSSDPQAAKTVATLQRRMEGLRERIDGLTCWMATSRRT